MPRENFNHALIVQETLFPSEPVPKIASYFFDITTASRWSGLPVGIVRVERELAARARQHLGDRLGFCVYDRKAREFKVIKDELVPSILSGALSIEFETNLQGL